jgi:hypothetical protein
VLVEFSMQKDDVADGGRIFGLFGIEKNSVVNCGGLISLGKCCSVSVGRIFGIFIRFFLMFLQKSRKQMMPNNPVSKNTPKRDIVDTNPHSYCAPGTTRTNNTAFLPCGSGLNKDGGQLQNKC